MISLFLDTSSKKLVVILVKDNEIYQVLDIEKLFQDERLAIV